MNASADFRQDHRADEFVLNPNRFPSAIDRFFGDAIGERQGINFSIAALIDALFQEHRIFVRRGRHISRDDDVLDSDGDMPRQGSIFHIRGWSGLAGF